MAGEIPAPSGGTGYFQQGNILVNPVCDRYLDVTFQLLLPSPRFTVLGPQNGSNLNNTYYDTEQYTTGATGVGPPLEKVGRQRYKLVFRFNPVIQCFDKEGNQIHTNIAATPQDFLFPAPSGQLQSFDKFLFDGTGPDRPCEYQVVSCFVRPSPDRGVVVGCESCVEVELHIVGMAPKRNDNSPGGTWLEGAVGLYTGPDQGAPAAETPGTLTKLYGVHLLTVNYKEPLGGADNWNFSFGLPTVKP